MKDKVITKSYFTLCSYVHNNVYELNVISYVLGILNENVQSIFSGGCVLGGLL